MDHYDISSHEKGFFLVILVILLIGLYLLSDTGVPVEGPGPAIVGCGDKVCDVDESCSTCPQDCGECSEPIGPTQEELIIELLPVDNCEDLTDGQAEMKALETGEDYCSCISDELSRELCMTSLLDGLYYQRAMDSRDPSFCEYMTSGEGKEACIAVATQYVEYMEETDQFWVQLLTYRANQNFDLLLPLLEEKILEQPDDITLRIFAAESYATLAWETEGQGPNMQKAEEHLAKALEIDPNEPAVYITKGYLYEVKFEIISAIDSYDKALEIDPNNIDAYVGKGHAYRLISDPISALENFNKAKALDPEHNILSIYRNLCTMLSNNDEYLEQAIEDCLIVVDSPHIIDATSKADAHNALGLIYLRTEQFEKASAQFELSLTYLPDNPNTYIYLSRLSFWIAEFEDGVEYAQTAISLDSQRAMGYYWLALSQMGLDMPTEAEQNALRALEFLDSDTSLLPQVSQSAKGDIYYLLAQIYTALGDSANAAKYSDLAEPLI